MLHYFQAPSPHFKKDFKNFIYIKSKPLKKQENKTSLSLDNRRILQVPVSTYNYSRLFSAYFFRELVQKSIFPAMEINKPFLSSPRPLYQNKVMCKCSAFDMEMIFHSQANKTHYHKKGCTLGLILKVRVFGTRKWLFQLLTLSIDYVLILLTRKSMFVPFGMQFK